MIRKTREELKDSCLVAITMYGPAAQWVHDGSYFRFRSGARLYMAYLENENDAARYQGWSLTRVYIEEMTTFTSQRSITRLLATLRSSKGIHCQMRCTCNPGGPGHLWVKQWIIDYGAWNPIRDEETKLTRVFIPARLTDNPELLLHDPNYINRLKAVGSPQLVKAWLEGDWSIIEGAFFEEWSTARHVLEPFPIPDNWIRFRAMDWGSARPFSIGWYAVVQDDRMEQGHRLPRHALVRYREWYGMKEGQPNMGLKMSAEEVAAGIVSRETFDGEREKIAYGVLDPSAWNVVSGPSIAETLMRHGAVFRRADNIRVSHDRRMGGWDQVRARLKGDPDDEDPMLFVFSTCYHLIRTLPVMQHNPDHAEDLDSDLEDHCADELRYSCMSRPFRAKVINRADRNPLLVSNAFKLNELR